MSKSILKLTQDTTALTSLKDQVVCTQFCFNVLLNLVNMHCPSDQQSNIRIAMGLVFCIVSSRLVCLFFDLIFLFSRCQFFY